jgi:hypothetical protein
MPAAQAFLRHREGRFTLAFRGMITVPAGPKPVWDEARDGAHSAQAMSGSMRQGHAATHLLKPGDEIGLGHGPRARLGPCEVRTNFGENQNAGVDDPATATRASANTSGSNFTMGLRPGEIAKPKSDPHRTKKNRFFYRTGSKGCPSAKAIQPLDLMSRRHPLSSTGTA